MTNLISFRSHIARKAAPSIEPEHVYERAAATAKKIRTALKASFPGVKFSVTSDTYSMGSSVDVHWTDGPTLAAVEAVARVYDSRREGQDRGYLLDGVRFFGAHHLFVNRRVSPERQRELEAVLIMHNIGPYDMHGYTHRQWEEAEELMVQMQAEIASLP